MLFKLLFCLFLLTPFKLLAQNKLGIQDIDRIKLLDQGGGMEGSYSTDYQIDLKNRKWVCVQVKQHIDSTGEPSAEGIASSNPNTKNIKESKFIREVSPSSITKLLNAITNQQKLISVSNLVDIKKLKEQAGSLYPMSDRQKQEFKETITPAKLKEAVSQVLQSQGTDVHFTCIVEIVKKQGGSIRLQTDQQNAFMLPWIIGKQRNYNKDISNFFANAIGNYGWSNKSRLQGKDFEKDVLSYIYDNYCGERFKQEILIEQYPSQVKYLASHFKIVKLGANDAYDPNDKCRATLQLKQLPSNYYIIANFILTKIDSIKEILPFKDSVLKKCKQSNFIFKYLQLHKNIEAYFHQWDLETIKDRLGEYWKESYTAANVIPFSLSFKTGDRDDVSAWVLLPDGKVALVAYDNLDLVKFSGLKLKEKRVMSMLAIFDQNGKVLVKEYAP